ncbi:hypothetical protein BDU57DRAFT_587524 [Ampelomyces quisqualis]|uniref:Uncharacterized protein n=1 Tax=Ampelomyces quisqualis TaxID=50730 RepID=A0A6A5QLT8_AMPQU|nr:hypothetical protein BDU57DRAFT_587524 [Ampelomyces quisqualis]
MWVLILTVRLVDAVGICGEGSRYGGTLGVRESSVQHALESIVVEYVELPIDYFSADKGQRVSCHGTVWNRYWVSWRSGGPGGPVFVYDVGESDASTNALFRLQDPASFFRHLRERYDAIDAIGIVWGYWFYGNSSPTPVDINTRAEEFSDRTTQQSLVDVDGFARQFRLASRGIDASLTLDSTIRRRRSMYADTISAANASSAPVQARIDQSVCFVPMWRGLNAYGFGNCTRDVQAAVRYVDRVFDSRNTSVADHFKILFLGLGAERNSHETFADALTTITAAWMSYGVEGGVQGLRRFCDWLETDTDGMKPALAGAQGWSGKKGVQWVVERWASYPWFTGNVNMYFETECSSRSNVPSMISWTWQYCTEWDICDRQFPNAPRDIFPSWPAVDRTNRIFGGCKEVFGYVIPGAQHCYDFRTTVMTALGGEVSRKLFMDAWSQWLRCWKLKGAHKRNEDVILSAFPRRKLLEANGRHCGTDAVLKTRLGIM